MAHDFRARSALHDVMFLSELELDSCHDENRAEETRADREENSGSRPPAAEVGDQGDTGECEPGSSDIHTGRARRAHVSPSTDLVGEQQLYLRHTSQVTKRGRDRSELR